MQRIRIGEQRSFYPMRLLLSRGGNPPLRSSVVPVLPTKNGWEEPHRNSTSANQSQLAAGCEGAKSASTCVQLNQYEDNIIAGELDADIKSIRDLKDQKVSVTRGGVAE